MKPFRMWTLPVISWALYDFANTIFSLAVITRYFNACMIDDKHQPDWHLTLLGLVVGVVLVVVMPAMGAVSDILGRRKPFLLLTTLICVAATAALGLVSTVSGAFVCAGIAIFAYELALAMYDPMLATVAPAEHRGRVSGFGVALGYVGSFVALFALQAIVGDGSRQLAFVPTALMFLVFALPIFLFVREPRQLDAEPGISVSAAAARSFAQVTRTVRTIAADHHEVARFLIARFLYVDAIMTVLTYMTVYMDRVGGFTPSRTNLVIALSIVFAVTSGVALGPVVERRGPKIVLIGILVLGTLTLLAAAATGTPGALWVLGPAVGVTLGGVWTSDRVFMMRLAPPHVRGELFAFYNLVGKVSSGVGPMVLWGIPILLLHGRGPLSVLDASRVALALLAGAIVAGIWVLRPLDDTTRYVDDEYERASAL